MDKLYVAPGPAGLVSVRGEDLPALLVSIAQSNARRPSAVILDVDGTLYSDRRDGPDVRIEPGMPEALAALGDDWVFLTAGQAPHRGIADPGILGDGYRVPAGNSYTDPASLMNDAVVGLTNVGPDPDHLPGTYIDHQDKPSVVVRAARLLRDRYLINQEDYMESMRRDDRYRWAIRMWEKKGDEDSAERIALLQTEIDYEAGRRAAIKARVSERPVVYFFDDNQFTIEATIRKTREFRMLSVFSVHVSPPVMPRAGRTVVPRGPRRPRPVPRRLPVDYNDGDGDGGGGGTLYPRTPPEMDDDDDDRSGARDLTMYLSSDDDDDDGDLF